MAVYTGKIMSKDFGLSATLQRQALEFLRSRGFDEAAACQTQVNPLALLVRQGGVFDLRELRHQGMAAIKSWAHGFGKLADTGVVARSGDVVRLREDLPCKMDYYLEPGARFIRTEVLGSTGRRPKNAAGVPKYAVSGAGGGLLEFATLNRLGSPVDNGPSFQVVANLAYLQVAKLRVPQ